MIVYIFILLYSISRFQDLSFLGLHKGGCWWNIITYNFVHFSFFHLVVNSILLLLYSQKLSKLYGKYTSIIIPGISTGISSSIFIADKPTFGSSGIIFSMLGMYLYHLINQKIKGYGKFSAFVVILILTQSLLGRNVINWRIHISCLLLSFIISFIHEYKKRI